jgi:YHS domain-containing protein
MGAAPSPALTPEQGLVPASQAPAVALEGYCPVSLLEQRKWLRSDPQFGAIHRGKTYLFATEDAQRKFLANPDGYSPALSGFDPVAFAQRGEMVEGKRSFGITFNRQIFLFADEASLNSVRAIATVLCGRRLSGDDAGRNGTEVSLGLAAP